MVTSQYRYTVTTLDPLGQQAVGHLVGRVVEFLERDLAEVVDDRGAVRRAARVERRDHAELAPAPDVGDHRRDVLRRFQLERAGLQHLVGVVQLCRAAFYVLLHFCRCLQRKIS